tara:strand:+ start:2111 stop:2695 length:585 start_codon:yes stop_codon:yes gene_type:complete
LKITKKVLDYCNEILQGERFSKIFPEKFLDEIDNKKVKIHFTKINLELFLEVKENSFILLESTKNFDVEFIASPLDFFMYIISKGSDKFSDRIKINGDVNTANKINDFLYKSEKFRLIISNLVGSEKAEKIENIYVRLRTDINNLFESATNDLSDFILEDITLLPTKDNINQFLDDVDNLRSRTDKLLKKHVND